MPVAKYEKELELFATDVRLLIGTEGPPRSIRMMALDSGRLILGGNTQLPLSEIAVDPVRA
jgi:hypothetical protein